jgi:dipeptidyl-peptidase-4
VTFAPSAKLYLNRYSRADRPPGLSLHAASGERLAEIAPARLERLSPYAMPVHEFVKVPARDGTVLRGRLLRPAEMELGRRYPVIVYVYGGPHAQVVRDVWDRSRALWNAMMVQRGFLIFSVDNRGSFGRGRDFERAVDRRLGQLELADQLAGVEWLKTLSFVDPERIGIWGGSYGGYMTLYALTHAPGVFRAGAAVAPVTDWSLYDTIYTERYMETPGANPEGYRAGSPLEKAAELRGALFLAHGTADDNVHLQNTLRFLAALTKAGVPYALQIHPGESHSYRGLDARRELYAALARFFVENL